VEDHSTFAPLALRLAQRSLALATEVLAAEALHAVEVLRTNETHPRGAGTGPLTARLDELIASGAAARVLVEDAARILR
jgi:histidine ammonia-lyase